MYIDGRTLFFAVAAMLAVAALVTVPHYHYWKRTGHSGWWCLLMLVPVVNIVALWVLAFGRWPIDGAEGPRRGRDIE